MLVFDFMHDIAIANILQYTEYCMNIYHLSTLPTANYTLKCFKICFIQVIILPNDIQVCQLCNTAIDCDKLLKITYLLLST